MGLGTVTNLQDYKNSKLPTLSEIIADLHLKHIRGSKFSELDFIHLDNYVTSSNNDSYLPKLVEETSNAIKNLDQNSFENANVTINSSFGYLPERRGLSLILLGSYFEKNFDDQKVYSYMCEHVQRFNTLRAPRTLNIDATNLIMSESLVRNSWEYCENADERQRLQKFNFDVLELMLNLRGPTDDDTIVLTRFFDLRRLEDLSIELEIEMNNIFSEELLNYEYNYYLKTKIELIEDSKFFEQINYLHNPLTSKIELLDNNSSSDKINTLNYPIKSIFEKTPLCKLESDLLRLDTMLPLSKMTYDYISKQFEGEEWLFNQLKTNIYHLGLVTSDIHLHYTQHDLAKAEKWGGVARDSFLFLTEKYPEDLEPYSELLYFIRSPISTLAVDKFLQVSRSFSKTLQNIKYYDDEYKIHHKDLKNIYGLGNPTEKHIKFWSQNE